MTSCGIFIIFAISLLIILSIILSIIYVYNSFDYEIEKPKVENEVVINFKETDDLYFEKYRSITGESEDKKIYKLGTDNKVNMENYLGTISIVGGGGYTIDIDFKDIQKIPNHQSGTIYAFSLPSHKIYKFTKLNTSTTLTFSPGYYLILTFI